MGILVFSRCFFDRRSVIERHDEFTALAFFDTHPISELELIAGKFLGSFIFTAIALLFVVPVAFSLSYFGNLDWGIVFGQFLSGILFGSVLISLGIFVSSLFSNQISSLLVNLALNFFLIIAGFDIVTSRLPLFLSPFFEQLSVTTHFTSMARGVIDLRDVWYFISVSFIFLALAYLILLKQKYGNQKEKYEKYLLGISLFIGISVLTNIVGSQIPGRIDLTQNKMYSLSSATEKTLSGLKDVVNITLYSSDELPSKLQPVLRETKDVLQDYKTAGKGNVVINYKNPSKDPDSAKEANSAGIKEIQFNVIGNEEFQVKNGYFGISVAYAGANEAISYVDDTSDLEYLLTSYIKKLTTQEKPKIAFLSGFGQKSINKDFLLLRKELANQFEVEEITIDDKNLAVPEGISTVVVSGPREKISDQARKALTEYLDKGGSVLLMIDSMIINPENLSAAVNKDSFADFLKDYGVTVNSDIVYDLRSNETVSFGGGQAGYFMSYPYWLRSVPADKTSQIVSNISQVTMFWPSSISIDEAKLGEKGFFASRLLQTTNYGGKDSGENISLLPDKNFSSENLGEQLLALSLKKNDNTTRIIVISDSDFLTDSYVQNAPEGIAFGMESLSWLSQEDSLAGIKLKQVGQNSLIFKNDADIALVKYGNLAFAFLLPLGLGLFMMWRRKSLSKKNY